MTTYIGSNRSEIIYGSWFRDIIRGNGGNDDIYGRDGADDLFGGTGNDRLYGGYGSDFLQGGEGINRYWGKVGFDRFIMSDRDTGYSDDTIKDFHFHVDQIDLRAWGVSSFEQVRSIMSNDSHNNALLKAGYNGYGHFLTIAGHRAESLSASDFIFDDGGARNDTGTDFGDVMFGSRTDDRLNGDIGNDDVIGGQGNDKLLGGQGADHLMGGSSSDTLTGGLGLDTLEGGAGGDTFRFTSTRESTGANRDVIIDFLRDRDVIDVSKIDADTTTAGNQAFEWVGDSIFTGIGQLAYGRQGDDIIIIGNTDTDRTAEFEIRIIGVFTPHDTDFIL